jgi:hypothetical protein
MRERECDKQFSISEPVKHHTCTLRENRELKLTVNVPFPITGIVARSIIFMSPNHTATSSYSDYIKQECRSVPCFYRV